MSADLEHIRQIMREADCLYTEAQVEEAIAKVGAHITREMADTNPVVFCVMNGGLIFAGKLLTHLQFPLEASYLHAHSLSQRNQLAAICSGRPSRKSRSSTATC